MGTISTRVCHFHDRTAGSVVDPFCKPCCKQTSMAVGSRDGTAPRCAYSRSRRTPGRGAQNLSCRGQRLRRRTGRSPCASRARDAVQTTTLLAAAPLIVPVEHRTGYKETHEIDLRVAHHLSCRVHFCLESAHSSTSAP